MLVKKVNPNFPKATSSIWDNQHKVSHHGDAAPHLTNAASINIHNHFTTAECVENKINTFSPICWNYVFCIYKFIPWIKISQKKRNETLKVQKFTCKSFGAVCIACSNIAVVKGKFKQRSSYNAVHMLSKFPRGTFPFKLISHLKMNLMNAQNIISSWRRTMLILLKLRI